MIGPGVHEVYEMVENVLQDATRELDAQPNASGAWQRVKQWVKGIKKDY